MALVVGAVTALIGVLRIATSLAPAHGIWAEDGGVFLQDARRHVWRSILSRYAGYGHLVPRLLGELGNLVDVEHWPTLVIVVWSLIIAMVGATVWLAARGVGVGPWLAAVAALAIVAVPGKGVADLGSWAYLQWTMTYALIWVLIVSPAASSKILAILVGGAALSSSLIPVLVLPLVFVHGPGAWRRHPAIWGAGVGLGYQVAVQVATSVSIRGQPRSAPRIGLVKSAVQESALTFVGDRRGAMTGTVGTLLGVAVLAAVGAVIVTSKVRLPLLVTGTGAVVALAATTANGSAAPQYLSFFATCVVAALVLAVDPTRVWHCAVVGTVLATWCISFPISAYRADVPEWRQEYAAAHARCADNDRAKVKLRVGPRGWGAVVLTCEDL